VYFLSSPFFTSPLDPGTNNVREFFQFLRDSRLAIAYLLPHSLPVLDFDSVRFLLPLEGEVTSLTLSLSLSLSSRPHCVGVNYVRINAES